MAKLSWQYLAGLVDGEGCLMITRLKLKKSVEAKRGIRFAPVMTIANTYIPLLEMIRDQFGGRIREEHTGTYAIYFNASDIRSVLPRLMPYLVIKKSQAEVLMDFLNKTESMGPRNLTDEQFAYYEQCFFKMKDMKKLRFKYDWSPKEISKRICSVCGSEFTVYSNSPRKKFCTDHCKRKDCWTRSNARIRAGTPAWAGRSHGGVPQEHIEYREN